jgi:hypothetical protein
MEVDTVERKWTEADEGGASRHSPKSGGARMFGIYSGKRYWYVLCVLDGVEIWD